MRAHSDDAYFRLSIFQKLVKSILYVFKTLLPNSAYLRCYALLRRFKQWSLEQLYSCITLGLSPFVSDVTCTKFKLTRRLLPYTMGGWKAMHNAFESVELVESAAVPGALVECGVARGGCSAMMGAANLVLKGSAEERVKWLFDSYEGLPKPTDEDFVEGQVGDLITPLDEGDCVGTYEEVASLMIREGFSQERVCMIKGWFQDTIAGVSEEIGLIAVLRLDGDWYESTRLPLDLLYDQVSPGGVVIIDDYGTCFGSRKAVNEIFEEKSIASVLHPDGRGGAWWQKQ